ncbi:hypothetical protein MRX96_054328 [Rhipicephalus microplus]
MTKARKIGDRIRKEKVESTITGKKEETSRNISAKVATCLLSSIPIPYPDQAACSGRELDSAAGEQRGGDGARGDPNNIPP